MYKSFQPSNHEIHRAVFFIVSGTKMRENKNLHVTHALGALVWCGRRVFWHHKTPHGWFETLRALVEDFTAYNAGGI